MNKQQFHCKYLILYHAVTEKCFSRSVTKAFPLCYKKSFFYPLQKISLSVIGMAMTFNCTGTRIAVQIGVRFNITGWLGEGATSVVLSRKKICVSGKIII